MTKFSIVAILTLAIFCKADLEILQALTSPEWMAANVWLALVHFLAIIAGIVYLAYKAEKLGL